MDDGWCFLIYISIAENVSVNIVEKGVNIAVWIWTNKMEWVWENRKKEKEMGTVEVLVSMLDFTGIHHDFMTQFAFFGAVRVRIEHKH